jgi:hypothetical protein
MYSNVRAPDFFYAFLQFHLLSVTLGKTRHPAGKGCCLQYMLPLQKSKMLQ